MTSTTRFSVAMTRDIHDQLIGHLVRPDGQEDICLATYAPSTGMTRRTAIVTSVILPKPGERAVHGTASLTGDYVLRAAGLAHARGDGLALLHSHPRARTWQGLSPPDRDAESSYANLIREITSHPLFGMTLSGKTAVWSARCWDRRTGRTVEETDAESVRVLGERLSLSWNDELVRPPARTVMQMRSASCWGDEAQADLARRSVLVVGLGSVGLDVSQRLAAAGMTRLGLMDFDAIEAHNLDRLIGATPIDAYLRRAKAEVAHRLVLRAATSGNLELRVSEASICEPEGLAFALDYDVVISCVDRPWPRAVLNALGYRDLVPVIDGGIAIDAFPQGGLRNATWRSHVIRPGRACLACIGQLDLADVTLDRAGLLEDPTYISGLSEAEARQGQNVTLLSTSVTASLLAQFVSYNVGAGGLGEPGPLQYLLSTHTLEHLSAVSRPDCPVEALYGEGDRGMTLTGQHHAAVRARTARSPSALSRRLKILRSLDTVAHTIRRRGDEASRRALTPQT